ncbi:MAG: thiol-activated cytolysin family protein [Arcicella sp.]|jgi:hypothetical protein|nr:thiol-activated cytolysin family protein [Arcicella sp.]
MKHICLIKNLLILSILFSHIACKKTDSEPVKPIADIDALIRGIPELMKPSPSSRVKVEEKTSNDVLSGESKYACKESYWKFSSPIDQFSNTDFNNSNTSELYPGAIVKLNEFANDGVLTSLGNIPREDITLTSTLTGATSKVVNNPNLSTVKKAIDEITTQFGGTVQADYTYNCKEAYNTQQGLLEFGINARWGLISGSAALKVSDKVEEKSAFIVFTQKYQTVSVGYAGSPSGFFGSGIKVEDLKNIVAGNNPLGYISQVVYGRVLIAKITYSGKEQLTEKDLALKLNNGLGKVGFTISDKDQQIFKNLSTDIVIVGGSATDAANIIGTDKTDFKSIFTKIYDYVKNGANKPTLGVPIGYTVRYLSTNNPVSIGFTADYVEKNCVINPQKVVIKSITFTELPSKDPDGNDWDFGGLPDVFYGLSTPEGTIIRRVPEKRFTDVTSSMISSGKITWSNVDYEIKDFTKPIDIDAYDFDNLSDDEYMGYVRVLMSNYTKITSTNNTPYPTTISEARTDEKTKATIVVRLELEWK